jgi:hypothetical protein
LRRCSTGTSGIGGRGWLDRGIRQWQYGDHDRCGYLARQALGQAFHHACTLPVWIPGKLIKCPSQRIIFSSGSASSRHKMRGSHGADLAHADSV